MFVFIWMLSLPARPGQGAGWSPGDRLPPLILSEINQRIAGSLRVDDLSWQVPNVIVAKGLHILDPEGVLVASVDELRARIDVAALGRKTLRITELPVRGLKLRVQFGPKGLNLTRTFATHGRKSKDAPMKIDLQNVSSQGASVIYKGGKVAVAVGNLSLSGSLTFDGQHLDIRAPMQSDFLVLQVGKLKFRADKLKAQGFRLDEKGLSVSALDFKLQDAPNQVSGALRWKPSRYHIDGKIRLPAGYWPEGLAAQDIHQGMLAAKVQMRGILADPNIQVKLGQCAAKAYGQDFQLRSARLKISKKDLFVDAIDAAYAGGQLSGQVRYRYASRQLLGDLRGQNLRLRDLAKNDKMRAKIDADVHFEGPLGEQPKLALSLQGYARKMDFGAVHLLGRQRLSMRGAWSSAGLKIERSRMKGPLIDLSAVGDVLLKEKSLQLDLRLRSPKPAQLLKQEIARTELGELFFQGRLHGTFSRLVLGGLLQVEQVKYAGFVVDKVKTQLRYHPEELRLRELQASLAKGLIHGELKLGLTGDKLLDGSVQIAAARLEHLPYLSTANMQGPLNVSAIISGTLKNPSIDMTALSSQMQIRDAAPLAMQIFANYAEQVLRVRDLRLSPLDREKPLLNGHLELSLASRKLDGELHLQPSPLHELPYLHQAELQGQVQGPIHIAGTLDAPQIFGQLALSRLLLLDSALGSGFLNICWQGDQIRSLLALGKDLPAQAPCQFLAGPGARIGALDAAQIAARFDYQLQKRQAQIDLGIKQLQIDKFISKINSLVGIKGRFDAHFSAAGALAHLRGQGQIKSSRLWTKQKTLGEAQVDLRLNDAQLQFALKAFDSLRGQGSLGFGSGSTRLNALLDLNDFTPLPFVASLREQQLDTRMDAQVQVNYDSQASEPLKIDMPVQRLLLQVDKQQRIFLQKPAFVRLRGSRLELEPLVLVQQQAQVIARGHYSPDDVDLRIDGDLALPILQALTPQISRAQGLCRTALHVYGRADHLQYQGELEPKAGSSLTPRSLGRALQFMNGQLVFNDDAVQVNKLKIQGLGGELQVNGAVKLRDAQVERYDLELLAENIYLRQDPVRGEISGDIFLRGAAASPVLSGRVSVVDGQFVERYQLRNFVAAPTTYRDQRSLAQRFPDYAATQLDLTLDARDLRAHADMGSIIVDLSGSADLSLAGTLADPEIGGALDVEEGRVKVIDSRLEVESSSVDFPARADRRIVPRIQLSARSMIPPEASPTGAELPVVLTLRGDIERMHLDLKTEESSEQVSRAELISLLATGHTVGDLLGQTSGDAAMRLVSREIFSEVERRVEDNLNQLGRKRGLGDVDLILESGTTGARTGLRWELNQRLQFEGETTVSYYDREDPSASNGVVAAGTLRHALRARWLVSDNLPLVDSLAFEADLSNLSTADNVYSSVDLKLTMRIFEL